MGKHAIDVLPLGPKRRIMQVLHVLLMEGAGIASLSVGDQGHVQHKGLRSGVDIRVRLEAFGRVPVR